MLELLQGKLSDNVMKTVTDRKLGLFPQPNEIKLDCDCPDYAALCKHLAAVLYGVGARLDQSPELLFLLRDVDHMDLIEAKVELPKSTRKKPQVSGNLSDIFGIDLDDEVSASLKKTARIANKAKIKKATKKKVIPATKINISRGIRASHIKKLRKEFEMTDLEFAKLLGKPVLTIRNWEIKKGVLNLQTPSQLSLEKAFKMDKKEAWKQLSKYKQKGMK